MFNLKENAGVMFVIEYQKHTTIRMGIVYLLWRANVI